MVSVDHSVMEYSTKGQNVVLTKNQLEALHRTLNQTQISQPPIKGLIVAYKGTTLHTKSQPNWVLDSSAINNITGNTSLFFTYTRCNDKS